MPFVSKFSGHGRVPGIHKPAAPPIPSVSNTATSDTTLTFNIANYNATWVYTGVMSPNNGTISFSGATISVTGLTASTAYTITVTATGSGGQSSGTGSATTAAPPPFFPPFFPFFPFFPPFFPFFPPFFPFFPPFFPFFPPFFPSFRPPPPPSKTAPSNQLRDNSKIMILTSEYGYLEPKYLTEEDVIVSIPVDIKENEIVVGDATDTVLMNISSETKACNISYINGNPYPENAKLLFRKDGVSQFISPIEADESYEIFDYESSDFIKIDSISVEEFYGIVYNIECSPSNVYVIQSSVGYFQ